MAAWIVRKRQTGRDALGGSLGPLQVIVYAATSAKAAEEGAGRLGVRTDEVETFETDDKSGFAIQAKAGMTIDPSELEDGNNETRIVSGPAPW
jgi:hypothetical protein